jgi:PKD repeat protein
VEAKDMKKPITFIIISLIISVVLLSGCTSIQKKNNPPTLTVIANPTSGYQPLTVNFQITANDSDGSIQSYYIDYGDGTHSNETNIDHTYHTVGVYTCAIIVTDDKGSTTNKSITITVNNHEPTASITTDKLSGKMPLTIHFIGGGIDIDGTIVSYVWNFGDGSSSSEQNLSHTFRSIGNYSVILTVTDNNGGNDTASVSIDVTHDTPPTPPTVNKSITLNPIADAYVDSDDPYTNFGNEADLSVDVYLWKITYIKFDLSSIPSGSTIHRAKLVLYVSDCDTNDILCYRSNDISWEEYTINWGNRPSYIGEAVKGTYSSSMESTVWEIDSENSSNYHFVHTSLSSGKITLVLIDDASTSDSPSAWFYSREHPYAFLHPELTIEYS